MKARAWVLGAVGAVALVGAGVGGFQFYVQRQAEARVAETVAKLPPAMKVSYGEVKVGFLGRDLRVSDISVDVEGGAPLKVEELHVLSLDRSHNPPHYLHAKASGITQDISGLEDEQVSVLRKLGYNQMRGSYEIRYRYDAAAREMHLQQLSGELNDMAAVTVALTLSNFDLNAPPEAKTALPEFELKEASLQYRDASLVSRVIRQGAEEQGMSEADFVAKLLTDLETQMGAQEHPFFGKAKEELKSFIQKPQALTVSAKPGKPVPIVEVMTGAMLDPADLPQLLNLEIKAQSM